MAKPKVIGFIQSKGGSGKTTSSMSTLGGLMEIGKSVCLFDVDADEPDSHTWANNGKYFNNVHKINHKGLRQRIEDEKESNSYDIILLDTPGDLKSATMLALSNCDLCLIPLQPSGMDVAGGLEVEDLCNSLGIPYRFILVCSANTINTRDVANILRDRPSLSTDIPRSVYFVNAFNDGEYIGNIAKNSKPHIAVKKICKEIIEVL
jgi:chromosome partitioning protein